MWWLIAVALIILLLLIMPVGIRGRYDSSGGYAWITAGPFRILLYPDRNKNVSTSEIISGFAKKKTAKGGKLSDFLPLLGDVLELLSELRRKLRVKRLNFKVILAGNDPCDLAINYGKAWSALGNLMPRLEQFLTIRKRNLEVECDFTADKTLIFADIHITIPLFRLVVIVLKHGSRILVKYRSIIEQRKGGTNYE